MVELKWIGHRHVVARHSFRPVFGSLVLRHRTLLKPQLDAGDEGDDEHDVDAIDEADELSHGDRGMDVFEPQ